MKTPNKTHRKALRDRNNLRKPDYYGGLTQHSLLNLKYCNEAMKQFRRKILLGEASERNI